MDKFILQRKATQEIMDSLLRESIIVEFDSNFEYIFNVIQKIIYETINIAIKIGMNK